MEPLTPTPTPSPLTDRRHVRILIVDDIPQVRQGLRALLEFNEEMVVVGEAINGLDAVHKAERLHPDVVVMDLEMPEMDGCEAASQIKGRGLAARVVILTIHSGKEVEERIKEAGADSYVEKGASYPVLIRAILQAE
jgi:DNA-binding NarL/FixJ family response regulator